MGIGTMGISTMGIRVGSIRIGSMVGYNWGNGGNWEGSSLNRSKGSMFTGSGSVESGLENSLSLGDFGKVSQVSGGSLNTSVGDDGTAINNHETSMLTGNSGVKGGLEFGLCGDNLGGPM